MWLSFTCILFYSLLVTAAVAIPVPREGHPASSLSRRDSHDVKLEVRGGNSFSKIARVPKAPHGPHPNAWGKDNNKKLPTKSKQERTDVHLAQQQKAAENRERARQRKADAKKVRVEAKAKSTQEAAKDRLAKKKEAGRQKFDSTRVKYSATADLPSRKTTFTTPGNLVLTGADARRAVWNSHHFSENPTNNKPAELRNSAGPDATNPQPIIQNMKGVGTEFTHHQAQEAA